MRALKRAQDERELAAVKQKDIEKLQVEIEDLQQKREELLARIAKYASHSKYLERGCFLGSIDRCSLHSVVIVDGGNGR